MISIVTIRVFQFGIASLLSVFLHAQPNFCPSNIDFSMGNFTNWECRIGTVAASGGQNIVSWYGTGEVPDRHVIIDPANKELDEYGRFPKHCPNTNSYSVRLGNDNAGHEAEGLFYTYNIPSGNTSFSLLYYYAIVLQNPNHQPSEQPRFRAKVIDVATETEINCVSFDFSSSGSLPGFQPTAFGDAVYKNWTPISVDLSAYAGKTIRLEFITSDCTFQQHFGYAYISIGSACNGSISGNYQCDGDTTLFLTAPFGFQQYSWYSDAGFGKIISSFQNVSINISDAPPGTVLPVIVIPYPGYGCLDTLYAIITRASKPVSNAGADLAKCSKQLVAIGGAATSNYSYSWTPAQYLLNPNSASPLTLTTILSPTEFIVKTTDLANGCISFDTTVVTPILLDTSSTLTGKTIYCPGQNLQNLITVTSSNATIQWYKGNTLINGATSPSFSPSSVGTYWAEINQGGCIDSSFRHVIREAALPKADFTVSKEVQCLYQPVTFSNKTTIAGNEPIAYTWRFSDGFTSRQTNEERSFTTTGSHYATLVASSGVDCIDSIRKTINIVASCAPILPTAFTPNHDGKNDVFKPYLVAVKQLKRFAVYNRYGNIVFSTTKEGEGWDGTLRGAPLETAVFVWVLEYTNYLGQTVTEKGTVTLIR